MKNVLVFLLFFGQLTVSSQCPYYSKYIGIGNNELSKGNKANFEKVINAYSTAMLHCPDSAEVTKNKILQAFRAIEKLKTDADNARKIAQDALAKVKKEQQKTQLALVEATNARRELDSALVKTKMETIKTQKALDELKNVQLKLTDREKQLDSLNKKNITSQIDSTAKTDNFVVFGQVRELNSKKRPLAGVHIVFEDALPTVSDAQGKFRLVFKNKKPGSFIFLREINKEGYALVNKKEFDQVKLSNTGKFDIDIILAKTGVLDVAKKSYYQVSYRALRAKYDKEKELLRAQRDAVSISSEQFEKQWIQLFENYENTLKTIDDLADKFARVNFDEVDTTYREALELFKMGQVDSSIQKIDQINLLKRENTLSKEIDIEKEQEKLSFRIAENMSENLLLSDIYIMNLEYGKADAVFEKLLRIDSNNIEILQRAANFYFKEMNDLHKSSVLYNRLKDQYLSLLNKDSASTVYKSGLAVSYEKLGETHTALGKLVEALTFYEEHFRLSKELYDADPKNVDFKNGLDISYGKLGSTHTALGNLDKALTFYEEHFRLSKELYDADPKNVDFKNGLAISYQYLGNTQAAVGNLDKALTFYEDFNRLEKELYEADPKNVNFKNGLAISYEKLGETHTAVGNLDKALSFYEERIRLSKELYEVYPSNVDFKNGLAISYESLGETHTALGNFEKALSFFEQYNKLEKELYEAYPSNVGFKNGLAISYAKLGYNHAALNNLNMALIFFEQYNKLEKELYEAFPYNVNFKNGLAVSCQFLGKINASMGNVDKALAAYENYIKLMKELYEAYPNNITFKNGYAFSCYTIGVFSRDQLKDNPKAKIYFQQAEKLWKELTNDFPQNSDFAQSLDLVMKILISLN